MSPDDFREIGEYVDEHRVKKGAFDMVMMGSSKSKDRPNRFFEEYLDAGVTWYLELVMGERLKDSLEKVRRGPRLV
jgi:hypothetical protein